MPNEHELNLVASSGSRRFFHSIECLSAEGVVRGYCRGWCVECRRRCVMLGKGFGCGRGRGTGRNVLRGADHIQGRREAHVSAVGWG